MMVGNALPVTHWSQRVLRALGLSARRAPTTQRPASQAQRVASTGHSSAASSQHPASMHLSGAMTWEKPSSPSSNTAGQTSSHGRNRCTGLRPLWVGSSPPLASSVGHGFDCAGWGGASNLSPRRHRHVVTRRVTGRTQMALSIPRWQAVQPRATGGRAPMGRPQRFESSVSSVRFDGQQGKKGSGV